MPLTRNDSVDILESVIQEIRVPQGKYEQAREHYNGVAHWLDAEGSILNEYNILVFPQGSFAHQTAIRPINGNDYDVDLVCLLREGYQALIPQRVRSLVGARLQEEGSPYRDKLDPPGGGRRCWKIRYAESENFHLDILPAVPDDMTKRRDTEWELAIRATDTHLMDEQDPWTYSNPQGFAQWFAEQGRFQLPGNILGGHREIRMQADPFPEQKRINALQGAVQILKRDRDTEYGTDSDKPISVIITTLVGRLAEGSGDILEALQRATDRRSVSKVVQQNNGQWVVQNPWHPGENFADKWNENNRKVQLFHEWMEGVRQRLEEFVIPHRRSNAGKFLGNWISKTRAAELCKKYGIGGGAAVIGGNTYAKDNWSPSRPTTKSSGGKIT